MSKDLKHRVPAFRKKRSPSANARLGVRLFGGLLFVTVIAAGFHRLMTTPHKAPAWLARVMATPSVPEPEFRFFKVLPDGEAIVTEAAINTEHHEVRLGKPPVTGQFFLQAGSFNQKEQAENLKARLETLDRLKPRLEMIKLDYATWYRVKLGPYRSLQDADRVRLFLRDRHIDSIIQEPVE
jgi:cell division protein FtsN